MAAVTAVEGAVDFAATVQDGHLVRFRRVLAVLGVLGEHGLDYFLEQPAHLRFHGLVFFKAAGAVAGAGTDRFAEAHMKVRI